MLSPVGPEEFQAQGKFPARLVAFKPRDNRFKTGLRAAIP